MEIELTDVRKIVGVIKDKYQVDFGDYALSSFKRRLARIVEIHRFSSVDALIAKLHSDTEYFQEFLSEITVNVTEMFRDPRCWQILRDTVIPELLTRVDRIRIWHAGCSSGEEVASMLILLKEASLLDRTLVFASDIDKKILSKAQSGIFQAKNFELNKANYIRYGGKDEFEKYFSFNGEECKLDPELLKLVSFRTHNLVSNEPFSKFDLILCRNVLIYFNQQLQNHVLKTFYDGLFQYGYLAIGSKESLIWCDYMNRFTCIDNEDKVYQKTIA